MSQKTEQDIINNLTKQNYSTAEVIEIVKSMKTQFQSAESHRHRFYQIGEMTANLVHDLKNPLNSFNMLAEGISWVIQDLEDSGLSGEVVNRLKNIEILMTKQITEYDKRLTGISALAKQTEFSKEMSAKDLEKIVTQLLSMFVTQFQKYEAKMLIDIDWATLSDKKINMNPGYLTQALSCGLKNALESLQRNKPQDKWIKISIKEDTFLKITIQDSVAPELESEKYFTRGFTTKTDGLGLGLNVAQEILEMFESKIYFLDEHNGYTALVVAIKYA